MELSVELSWLLQVDQVLGLRLKEESEPTVRGKRGHDLGDYQILRYILRQNNKLLTGGFSAL